MTTDEVERIDGMTRNQVSYNVYAFGVDVRKWQRKADRARKDHTRAAFLKRRDEAAKYQEDNRARLARFAPQPAPGPSAE